MVHSKIARAWQHGDPDRFKIDKDPGPSIGSQKCSRPRFTEMFMTTVHQNVDDHGLQKCSRPRFIEIRNVPDHGSRITVHDPSPPGSCGKSVFFRFWPQLSACYVPHVSYCITVLIASLVSQPIYPSCFCCLRWQFCRSQKAE